MRQYSRIIAGALLVVLFCACVITQPHVTEVAPTIQAPTAVATKTTRTTELDESVKATTVITEIIQPTEPQESVKAPTAIPLESDSELDELPRLAVITPENAAEVTQIAQWGKGTAEQVAYAPNGRLLAVASSLGIYLYDAQKGTEINFIPTDVWIQSVVFSPDSTMLAAGATNIIQLLRVSDGALLWAQEIVFIVGPQTMAFSPDGSTLVTAGHRSHVINLWQVSDGTRLGSLLDQSGGHISVVAFAPNGMMLAAGSDKGVIHLWRVSDKTLLHALSHGAWVTTLAFTPDSATLAVGSRDGIVSLWQVSDGSLLRALERRFTDWVHSIAFAPDGETLAVAPRGFVELYRLSDGTHLRSLRKNLGDLRVGVAFAPDGATLVSLHSDGAIRFWRASDGTLLKSLEGHLAQGICLAFSPDGTILASGSYGGDIRLWTANDGTLLRVFTGGSSVASLAFSPDGAMLATGRGGRYVGLRRVADGELMQSLEIPNTFVVTAVTYSPDGAMLAAGGWGDCSIRLWQVNNGIPMRTFEQEGDRFCQWANVAFSPDGSVLAVSGEEGLQLWQVADWTLLRILEVRGAIAFSPDGQKLASGSGIWRLSDGEKLQDLERSSTLLYNVVFSPDGSMLAFFYADGRILLRRVVDGTLLATLEGHILAEQPVGMGNVVFAPNGALLASGAADGTIRLWGVKP